MSTPIINSTKPPQSREDYLREQDAASRRVTVNTGGYASQAVSGGQTEMVVRPGVTTAYARDTDYEVVTVNGASMKRDQYLRLVTEGALPPGAKVDDPYARRIAAEEAALGPFGETVAHNAEGDGKDGTEDQKSEAGSDPAAEAVFSQGQTALDTARAELGADTVEGLIGEAVMSGDLDAVTKALEGGKVSAESVGKVYAAYVASAQEMLGATGMSVETMSEVLGDEDLRAAREAVVRGDVSRVQDLAGKARDTLATLPERDPEAFASYVDRRWPDLAYRVEKGQTLVATDRGWIPFGSLVRGGLLANAKLTANGADWTGYED